MCEQCEATMINGIHCHETGCPDAWKTRTRDCAWCGQTFLPENRDQQYCDETCEGVSNY